MESIRRYRSSITVVSISASPSLVWIRKLPTQVFPTYQTLGATRNGSMATFQGMVLALFTVSIGVTFTLLMIVIIPFFSRPAAPAGHSFIIFLRQSKGHADQNSDGIKCQAEQYRKLHLLDDIHLCQLAGQVRRSHQRGTWIQIGNIHTR